jgi:hypothetical protein
MVQLAVEAHWWTYVCYRGPCFLFALLLSNTLFHFLKTISAWQKDYFCPVEGVPPCSLSLSFSGQDCVPWLHFRGPLNPENDSLGVLSSLRPNFVVSLTHGMPQESRHPDFFPVNGLDLFCLAEALLRDLGCWKYSVFGIPFTPFHPYPLLSVVLSHWRSFCLDQMLLSKVTRWSPVNV